MEVQDTDDDYAVFYCAECSMNVHHKCQKKVANLCGVNQKLMAEALAIIETKQQVRPTHLLVL